MSPRLALVGTLLLLVGCDMSSLPHGNLGMPDMSGGPGFTSGEFNGKNYPDPNPRSASDDAQRAAYQQHQQDQLNDSGPDLSRMSCSSSSVSSSGANAGTFSSNSSCHN
jgi:hypothetical protein